jgi:hypothetical protein
MAKEKDGNLTEGKTPEEMTSAEIENFITLQSKVIPVDENLKEIEVKDEPSKDDRIDTEKDKDEKPKEKQEKDSKQKDEKPIKEELILGKFKNQEDFIKAYQEAEKKISQQGEETAKERRLRLERERVLSQVYDFDEVGNMYPKQPVQQPNDPLAQLRARYPGWADEQLIPILEIAGAISNAAINNFKENQRKELEPLYEIKFEKDVEKQKKKIKENYPDYPEFESEVNDKLASLPPTLRAKDGSVETIFLTVRGEHTPELVEKAKRGVQKEVETIERKKEDAFVEGGGKTSVPTPPVDIEKMSSSELEKFIKKHPDYGKRK